MRVIKWGLIVTALVIVNLLIFEYLLRVNGIYERMANNRLYRELKNADHIFDFSPDMKEGLLKLGLEEKFNLDYHGKSKRIPYSAVEAYNPYPPILHLFDTGYVIYNKDFKLKQITILSGECDATPSPLVAKARGEQTGGGDHFVTYIFYQGEMSGNSVDYDRIDWYAWRGGSYDGFEEIWMVKAIVAELLILIGCRVIRKRRRKKNIVQNPQD
ncbi:MAG TPA: hypothetical protein VEC12_07545 [Bacteroidia bacterium]|nr:hypothetical protein [Bacteroidia bacterium]